MSRTSKSKRYRKVVQSLVRTSNSSSEQGERLTELRRSNAAGAHVKKRKDRYNKKRKEIEEAKDG